MKILVFAIVLFTILFVNTIAQQGWFQQNSGTESQLNSVFFLDSLNGWIVGDDSTNSKNN